MSALRDVKVGDPVLSVRGMEATSWEVESVTSTTVTAGARVYDKATGDCRQRVDGQRLRLRTPEEHQRDLSTWELGRYLAALHHYVEQGANLDAASEGLTQADLIRACHAGQRLCDLLGIVP